MLVCATAKHGETTAATPAMTNTDNQLVCRRFAGDGTATLRLFDLGVTLAQLEVHSVLATPLGLGFRPVSFKAMMVSPGGAQPSIAQDEYRCSSTPGCDGQHNVEFIAMNYSENGFPPGLEDVRVEFLCVGCHREVFRA